MTHPAPSLTLVDNDPAELAVDAIVIGLHSQPDEGGALLPAAGAESIAAAFDGKLTATLALLGATGVLQRHLPAAEGGELGSERDVALVQRRTEQGCGLGRHEWQLTRDLECG